MWLYLEKPQPQRAQRAQGRASFLRAVHVGAGAEENFRRLHDTLRKRGVRMDGERDVLRDGTHLDGENAFGNQVARACSHNSDTQNAFALRINDELGHTLGAVERHSPAGSAPGELGNFDLTIFFLCLRFSKTSPGDFGIGEDDGGNGVGLEGDLVSGDGFGGGSSFMRGFVRQHGLADYVSDCEDSGVIGLELLVDLNESAGAELDLGFVEAGNFGIGFAADRDEDFVEDFLALFDFRAVESHAQAAGFFFYCGNSSVEHDGGETLL